MLLLIFTRIQCCPACDCTFLWALIVLRGGAGVEEGGGFTVFPISGATKVQQPC